ncbi:hypothetical protein ABZ807_09350 [Micromonospora sp. NPDC047548]|uniref:hypothetical protein n=1 Tax=Micromonospora sp. NPDC047548 TaxID=3155624 RepID=UPI0033C34547
MTARTQEQILARYREIATDGEDDPFNWRQDVLLGAMTRDTAQQALPNADLTHEKWVQDDTDTAAREYLTFAIGKIAGHRGISASRSVDKLSEYAWLLGRDDVVEAMTKAEYPQYGAPAVKAFAEGMGWPWPGDVVGWRAKALARMAEGLPCEPDCADGCSW